MTATLVKILVGILALGLGILLGLPGKGGSFAARERREIRRRHGPGVHDEDELRRLEDDLGRPAAPRRRAKRHFTPLDLLGRERRGSERRRTRRYFRTAVPTESDEGPG